MKKFLFFSLLGLSVALVSTGARAFDLGNSIKNTAKGTAKSAAQGATADQINKKLAQQNCTYPSKTSIQPSCNIDSIVSLLAGFNSTAKSSGFANNVIVDVSAYGKDNKIARSRAEYLRDRVKQQISYWDYNVFYEKGGEVADIRVKIN